MRSKHLASSRGFMAMCERGYNRRGRRPTAKDTAPRSCGIYVRNQRAGRRVMDGVKMTAPASFVDPDGKLCQLCDQASLSKA